VASLTGPVTLLPAVASGAHAQTAIGTFPLRVEREGKCVLVLRPEDITLSPGGESTVVSRRFEGAGYSVEVSTSAGRVHMSFFSGIPPEKGAKVTLSVEQPVVALAAAE
jgi:iron(III) transport system ATP-binding protein